MESLRRQFLCSVGAAFTAEICGIRLEAMPQSRKMPAPPEPAEAEAHAAGTTGSRVSQRAALQQHEKEFRESLAALSERVNALQAEVEQLHSSDIFSVKIYKQTSEIEHFAKQLKNLARS
ncbi:MAG TPA: hypothetical protein VM781_00305 [Candidatus Bathyarchaeia archaeon]|nr:hypothetical protein [Candidatus Bathyarchaeia archaeon]